MSRVIKDGVWLSSKLANVQPQEWRPEYVWLLIGSFVDGTFECDPGRVWARAYAYSRPDWDAEKVAKLLDEFERVGLLQRAKDEEGRSWGFWTGPQYVKVSDSRKNHYAVGKGALFTQGSAQVKPLVNQTLTERRDCAPGVCVGLGVGVRDCACVGACVCSTKNSENEQKQEQPQDQERLLSKPLDQNSRTAEATPTPQDRKRPVLTPFEYDLERSQAETQRNVAEFIAAQPTCAKCGAKHPASMPVCPKAKGE